MSSSKAAPLSVIWIQARMLDNVLPNFAVAQSPQSPLALLALALRYEFVVASETAVPKGGAAQVHSWTLTRKTQMQIGGDDAIRAAIAAANAVPNKDRSVFASCA